MPDELARTLSFPDTCLRMRRDHAKYLTLIHAIALLRQYQRPWRQITRDGQALTFIEVTPEDIAWANKLADDVLGRSLDEMAPQTRRLLELVDNMVTERCAANTQARADFRFTRRECAPLDGNSPGNRGRPRICPLIAAAAACSSTNFCTTGAAGTAASGGVD